MATDDQTTDNGKSGSKLPVDTDKQVVSQAISLQQRQKLRRRALTIVNRYTLLSGGLGIVVPSSFFYQVAVGGLISKMLYDLSALFGTKLTKQKNKAMIAAVLGGAHSEWVSVYLGDNLEKISPGMSIIGNTIARPVVAAGITYAIGRLFIQHFATGAWLREPEASALNASLLLNLGKFDTDPESP